MKRLRISKIEIPGLIIVFLIVVLIIRCQIVRPDNTAYYIKRKNGFPFTIDQYYEPSTGSTWFVLVGKSQFWWKE